MNQKMLRSISPRLILIMLILSTFIVMWIPNVSAEGINLDGVVDETEWTLWFEDESQPPYFSVFWYMDSGNLYLAILTDDTNTNDDLLQFAFRASERDYLVEIKPGYWMTYRPSGGSWEGYWKGSRSGLPPGVSAVAGKTDGKRSYELSIELSILGKKALDFPEQFKAWFMVVDGTPEGPVNYYPDSRAGWWWQLTSGDDSENEELEFKFHVPELPLGTMMAVISGITALTLLSIKRPTIKK